MTQMRSLGFLHLWAPNSAEPGNNRAQGPGVRRVHRLSYTVPGPRSTITHSWGAPQILGKIPQNTPSWARETQSGVTERELATFSASLHPHTTWGVGAPGGCVHRHSMGGLPEGFSYANLGAWGPARAAPRGHVTEL